MRKVFLRTYYKTDMEFLQWKTKEVSIIIFVFVYCFYNCFYVSVLIQEGKFHDIANSPPSLLVVRSSMNLNMLLTFLA